MAAGGNTQNNDKMVEHMYETVLNHTGDYGRAMKVHLFCIIDGDDNPISITNKPKKGENQHAEELLIQELKTRKKLKEAQSSSSELDITVFISNSPCSSSEHNCAKKLRDFLNNNRNVRMTLHVTNLFKILRESCKDHKHHKDDEYYANTCGLWNLMHHGRCYVKPFSEAIWGKLFNCKKLLMFSEDVKGKLLSEYHAKRDYYDKKGKPVGKNDRSRNEEDELINSDLKVIGSTILEQIFKMNHSDLESDEKRTCLVCKIDVGENTVMLTKCDEELVHAEELLLNELDELDDGKKKLKITIFMNDTPCSLDAHGCVDQLIHYLKSNSDRVKLTLYVTMLNNLAQEHCIQYDQLHSTSCKIDKAKHENGLKELKKYCKIKGPSKGAWTELFKMMDKADFDPEFLENYPNSNSDASRRRIHEDTLITHYLEKI